MSIENGNTKSVSRAFGVSHGEPARVVLVQRRLTHYRVPLFQKMRDKLAANNIVLDLLVGEGTEDERQKRDAGHLGWAVKLPTRYFAGENICWQPVNVHLRGADLVVVTQENKLIYNHMMLLGRRDFRLAFWGHGANLQARNINGPAESFKRWTTPRVDWWFSYTQMTTDLILGTGFPQDRITTLNNAVDTTEMARQLAEIKDDEVSAVRQQLGLGDGPTGVFIGSLYADKRLDFLVQACSGIRNRIPTFSLLIIGDGPLADEVRQVAAKEPWIKWVGAKVGRDKLTHLLCGDVMLLPAAVNLCILDSFTLGLPLITTDRPGHNPEFAYLKHGINGLMSANGIAAYAEAVVGLLNSPAQRDELRHQCLVSAEKYTLEKMADRFCDGIVSALTVIPKSNGVRKQQNLTVSTFGPKDTTQRLLKNRKPLVATNRTFFTTSWDDGHPQDLRVVELLAKYGFRGTFYVPIRNDEGLPVLDAASMRLLASAAEIGSHTLDHRYLNTVSDTEASRQIVDGKRELEQVLGQPVAGFCYPGGAYSNRHCQMVAAAGFSYARTTSNLYDKTILDPLRMPTTLQLYPHGRRVFLTNYVRRLDWGMRGGLFWQALSAGTLELRLQAMLDAVLRSGGVFHLWGHSYELDEFDGWHLLEKFLQYAAERIPQCDRVDNGALALPGRYPEIAR